MTRVIVGPRAEAQALAADAWWRRNRDAAPDLFVTELDRALRRLANDPQAGRKYERHRVAGIRRLLLRRSRYHVYYQHDDAADQVHVLAVWGAERGRGPVLPSPRRAR